MIDTDDRQLLGHRNEVLLVGRISMPATRRELPSGVVVVAVRVVIERDPRLLRSRMARIDAIDCVAWREDCQHAMQTWERGDVVEISGALRRRFRRGDTAPMSRYEVEIESGRLLARCANDAATPSADITGPDNVATSSASTTGPDDVATPSASTAGPDPDREH
jgi:single-strand DNA-binding protein